MAEGESEIPLASIWRHYRSMIWRHRQLAAVILASCVLAAGVYTAMQIPLFIASTSVLIENRNQRIVGDVEIGVWLDQEEAKAQRILAKSRPVLERAAQLMVEKGYRPGKNADEVLGEFGNVDAKAQGRLLILEVVDSEPARAQELANCWNQAFVEESRDRQRSSSIYTRDFLGKQLPALRQDWIKKQEALQNFQIESNFIPHASETHPVNKRYAELDQKLKDAKLRLNGLMTESRLWEESKSKLDQVLQLPRVRNDRNILAYEILIQAQRKRLIELKQDYDANSLEVQKAQRTLRDLESEERQALDAVFTQLAFDLRMAQDEMQQLSTLFAAAEKEYTTLQSKSARYQQLAGDAQMAQKQYEELAQRQGEADVAGKVELSFAQTWERAEKPTAPFLPSWRRNITVGFILGILLASVAVYLREMLDDTVRTSEQLEKRLGISVLGSVPLVEPHWLREGGYALAKEHPRAVPVESLRSLRSSLTVSYGANGNGNGHKHGTVLLVTSPSEGEGKSFLSSNLSALFASAGKNVLLVDMDLHKASLTRHFMMLEEPGLQALGTSANIRLEGMVRPTPTPNLFLLPSGRPGPAPASIVESEAFSKLLESARAQYDVVVVDAPPVLAVADACSIASKCDAVLVTVRSRSTRLAQVDRTVESLQRAQAKECHCVLNALDASDAEASGYGYGSYYYQGGYAYGRRHPDESALHSQVQQEG
ncbi:MAG: polysaccharide biosynthesis tyrosine autokinase [Planctomycetota bacterium]|nr:polysaccharide biosynthesis tyrosine autokinase [Planctomycetota bacterium]